VRKKPRAGTRPRHGVAQALAPFGDRYWSTCALAALLPAEREALAAFERLGVEQTTPAVRGAARVDTALMRAAAAVL
jgi:hypothetical protein